jgi:hypothetical protein
MFSVVPPTMRGDTVSGARAVVVMSAPASLDGVAGTAVACSDPADPFDPFDPSGAADVADAIDARASACGFAGPATVASVPPYLPPDRPPADRSSRRIWAI